MKGTSTSEMSSSSSLEKWSEIGSAIEEVSMMVKLNTNETRIPYKPFISLCSLVLQVLDKIGPTMAVMRQDMYQNIQRLELVHQTNPTKYSNLVEILSQELKEGSSKHVESSSKAFLWLTRSLDFSVALLQNLSSRGSDQNMHTLVEDSYNNTLKKWHGWISSTAVRVALKLVPDHKTFINALTSKDQRSLDTIEDQMQLLISLLTPILEDIHSCLKTHGLDRLKSP